MFTFDTIGNRVDSADNAGRLGTGYVRRVPRNNWRVL